MVNKEELISILFTQALILLELFDDEEDDYNLYIKDIENCILFLSKNSIKRLKPRLYDDTDVILSRYSDKHFKSQFRIERSTFDYILNIIRPSLVRSSCGRKRISPKKQFLIALCKIAISDSYRSICQKFNVGRATALMALRRVIKAITEQASCFIKWPQDNRAEEIIRGFAATSAFPGIIGAIGGTHIKIKTPHINSDSYINKNGYPSIQLQV
ncbi:PREDICTED: putative nuclease HARBI1 [Cyphomyrmex costatus]|uniref:putative nuclease HARBI1 n=1 Tax=Cyphomyrmex costatus TaxID=456900 RepID=UPI0008523F62|nr:PREDICTED: putative nuclease HARBI1 [Cyphomyrmex costatus]